MVTDIQDAAGFDMNRERGLMTVAEAADLLGVATSTVNAWCRQGKFEHAHWHLGSQKFGWRIPREEVEDCLYAKRRQAP